MKNVLLVDDHDIVRQGLKNLIELEPDIRVTGEAASGSEALKLVRANKYDIIVLDISMPDKNANPRPARPQKHFPRNSKFSKSKTFPKNWPGKRRNSPFKRRIA